MPSGHLFDDLRPDALERVAVLAQAGTTRIERIVSWGQCSPVGFWYEQREAEWVALVRGRARLRLSGPDELRDLVPGDWIWIAAHRRHRVEWTDPDGPTVWIAVFCAQTPEAPVEGRD